MKLFPKHFPKPFPKPYNTVSEKYLSASYLAAKLSKHKLRVSHIFSVATDRHIMFELT